MEGGNIPALNARARQDGSGQPIIKIQPVLTIDRKEKRQNGRRFKNEGDPAFTLNCQDQHGIMITETKEAFHGDSINLKALTSKTQRGELGKAKTHTLDADCNQAVVQKSTIRRLTEIECERLQGFPDNWTKYGIYLNKEGNEVKKKIPKTQRYKLCGNAVSTDIVEIVATRLKECLITQ
jgi:DNA (cytosine-5)-methyltransferase 1